MVSELENRKKALIEECHTKSKKGERKLKHVIPKCSECVSNENMLVEIKQNINKSTKEMLTDATTEIKKLIKNCEYCNNDQIDIDIEALRKDTQLLKRRRMSPSDVNLFLILIFKNLSPK